MKKIDFFFLGVGWSMNRKLKLMGVTTCGQLQEIPQSTLQKEFGPKTGLSLYRGCRGQDDRLIKTNQERKSVSAEVNYGIRFKSVRISYLRTVLLIIAGSSVSGFRGGRF